MHAFTAQRGPVQPSSHEQVMDVALCEQLPWPEHPAVRFVQKGVSQFGPDQPSAQLQWPSVHVQSMHSRALQSTGPLQAPAGGLAKTLSEMVRRWSSM